MSVDNAPNSKYVTLPVKVPRDPEQYRSTTHFGQRLRQRVPDDIRGEVVRECIQMGQCSGAQHSGHGDVHQYFQFGREVEGTQWTVIVGIVLEAFRDPARKHLAVTIYGDGEEGGND